MQAFGLKGLGIHGVECQRLATLCLDKTHVLHARLHIALMQGYPARVVAISEEHQRQHSNSLQRDGNDGPNNLNLYK